MLSLRSGCAPTRLQTSHAQTAKTRSLLGYKKHQGQERVRMEADFEHSTAKFWINKLREEGDLERAGGHQGKTAESGCRLEVGSWGFKTWPFPQGLQECAT